MKKKLLTFVASLAILAGGIFGYFAIASPAEAASFGSNCGPMDNSANAIIRGGACSTNNMKGKVKGDVSNVFNHYNVPTNLAGAQKGQIHKNGNVTVDGKVVATGAQTVGRDKFGNSKSVKINGKTFWQGSPAQRWNSNTSTMNAFVFFDNNGEFKSAVLTSCGNPVTAKPKPKVAYKCDALTSNKIDRTRYDLEVKTSQHRATFQSVTFNVYDKSGNKVESKTSNSKKYRYTQTTPGEYTIKAVVTFKTHDGKTVKSKENDCVTKINVEEEPKKPVYDCDSLTATLIGEATDRTYKYNLEYTAENGAELQTVDFNFGDGNRKEGVTPSELSDVSHTYAKEGDYTTIATLQFNVGDSVKSAKCSVKITASPDKEEPCPYNPELPVGHPDCEEPKEEEPCPYDPTLPKDSDDCEEPEEPETPVTPAEPETPIDEKGKGEETPIEIPKTGAGSIIGAFAGLGSIGAASYYYLASRREVLNLDKFLNR